jgi:hypothetical protein
MPNTVDQAIAYARAHKLRDGGSWAGWCASFVYRAGGFDRAFSNAMLAGSSSGALAGDYRSARRGEIHYWAGVGGDGHVAIDIGGDDTDRLLLMASSAVSDSFGTAVGAVWFSQYARLGIPYRGHTFAWGNERLAGTASSTPPPRPAAPSITDLIGVDMPVLWRQGTPGYHVTNHLGQRFDTFGMIVAVNGKSVHWCESGDVVKALVPTHGAPIELNGDQFFTAIRMVTVDEGPNLAKFKAVA